MTPEALRARTLAIISTLDAAVREAWRSTCRRGEGYDDCVLRRLDSQCRAAAGSACELLDLRSLTPGNVTGTAVGVALTPVLGPLFGPAAGLATRKAVDWVWDNTLGAWLSSRQRRRDQRPAREAAREARAALVTGLGAMQDVLYARRLAELGVASAVRSPAARAAWRAGLEGLDEHGRTVEPSRSEWLRWVERAEQRGGQERSVLQGAEHLCAVWASPEQRADCLEDLRRELGTAVLFALEDYPPPWLAARNVLRVSSPPGEARRRLEVLARFVDPAELHRARAEHEAAFRALVAGAELARGPDACIEGWGTYARPWLAERVPPDAEGSLRFWGSIREEVCRGVLAKKAVVRPRQPVRSGRFPQQVVIAGAALGILGGVLWASRRR